MFKPLAISLALLAGTCFPAHAESFASGPEGAPGIPFRWAPALKQAIGTAFGQTSPVWFTIAQGILTEVSYPSVDRTQVGDLQFVVTDGKRLLSEQRQDTLAQVSYKDEGMAVRIDGQDRLGRYRYEQTLFADTASPVVRIRTTFHWTNPGLRIFILFRPAIEGRGSHTSGSAGENGLLASGDGEKGVHAAVTASVPWSATSAGYLGFSDAAQDLTRNFRLTSPWREAGPGNIVLAGELVVPPGTEFTYELALAFGPSRAAALTYARTAMLEPFELGQARYERGWRDYLASLERDAKSVRFIRESAFARRSAQLLKMHEDKRERGAIVASLSNRRVRPRELARVALGLLAAGDRDTPLRALAYLLARQRADGAWPRELEVAAKEGGGPDLLPGQLEDTAFPILLAWQLQHHGLLSPNRRQLEAIRKAAAFIISQGARAEPSASLLGAMIAGLRAATALAGDPVAAAVADEWQSRIERWTQGPGGAYLRPDPRGQGAFLELVRLGIREASDPRIAATVALYDSTALGSAEGTSYRRAPRDPYGPEGQGGFWPHLAGERGHYAVASGDLERARAQLHALERSALDSGLLPEQILAPATGPAAVSGPRVALGVACPLAWAHAEDILLHRSLEERSVFEKPPDSPNPPAAVPNRAR
ncbi:MAG: hypothetical protein NDJ89_10720 [Oligoflexia bacterium]|nr:hypothetical protein [Oligoflexia bacterium]